MTKSIEERARDLVAREVRYCVSALVSTLAGDYGLRNRTDGATATEDLCEQAMELASPIPDYESAAREAGWSKGTAEGGPTYNHTSGAESWLDEDWQGLCDAYDIEPYDCEVYEHWAVTDWFGEKLTAQGEKVDTDFAGMTVWARTTTGQAVYADAVVERIVRDLYADATPPAGCAERAALRNACAALRSGE